MSREERVEHLMNDEIHNRESMQGFSPDADPEQILRVVIDECLKPAHSINETARLLLLHPESKKDFLYLLEQIPGSTQHLLDILSKAREYLEARK